MTDLPLPDEVVEALRRAFEAGLRVEWKPSGFSATLRLLSHGVDGVVCWDCHAYFTGIAPSGRARGRPAKEVTVMAIAQLVEALEREAMAQRELMSKDGEDAATLRARAERMDAAAARGRMIVAEIEGRRR